MISTVIVLTCVTLGLGWLLLSAHARLKGDDNELIDAIDALLPQTQCAQCGYPGCRPYAEAVAGGAAIDLCPPGGNATFEALGSLLGRSGGVSPPAPENVLARIREEECIGCFLCTRACPVDAIIGAPGYMHTVIEDECTGCELCLPACPVDCIDLIPAPEAITDTAPGSEVGADEVGTAANSGAISARALCPAYTSGPHSENADNPASGALRGGNAAASSIRAEHADIHASGALREERPRPQVLPGTAHGGQPCIGCNRCEPVCPADLAPRELLWLSSAGKWDGARELGLQRCIECRLCDRACPSGIPLAQIFADGKRVLAERAARDARAAHVKARFEARAERLAAEQDAARARRAERLARRKRRMQQDGAAFR